MLKPSAWCYSARIARPRIITRRSMKSAPSAPLLVTWGWGWVSRKVRNAPIPDPALPGRWFHVCVLARLFGVAVDQRKMLGELVQTGTRPFVRTNMNSFASVSKIADRLPQSGVDDEYRCALFRPAKRLNTQNPRELEIASAPAATGSLAVPAGRPRRICSTRSCSESRLPDSRSSSEPGPRDFVLRRISTRCGAPCCIQTKD